jgi:hypothetical protein
MSRPRRFLPPIAGGSQKTGWEALEKWVVGGGGGQSETSAPSGPSGTTGWEALDKWVGDGSRTTPSAEASGTNGSAQPETAAAAAQPQAAAPAGSGSESGGLMGFLRRLFGGK